MQKGPGTTPAREFEEPEFDAHRRRRRRHWTLPPVTILPYRGAGALALPSFTWKPYRSWPWGVLQLRICMFSAPKVRMRIRMASYARGRWLDGPSAATPARRAIVA